MQLRRDMGRNLERNRTEVMVGDHCNVGYVAKIIARRIVHCTRVASLRSIALRRCKKLGTLVIKFLEFMQLWTTNRKIIRNPLLRWKVSFKAELFLF